MISQIRFKFIHASLVSIALLCSSHVVLGADSKAPATPTARPQPAPLVIPDTVSFERGVEFANPDDQHLQLDMARPKTGDGPFPAIVCIHGGGFRAGSRKGYDALCLRLAQQGYVACTVSYRLAPKYQFPAAVNDVKEAIRW